MTTKKEFLPSLSPRETALCLYACLMTGVVLGMLLSPRKTMTIGSHNSSNVTTHRADAPKEEETLCEQC